MQLVVGSISFAANSAEVTRAVRTVRAPTMRPLRYVNRVSVRVYLLADGQAALSALETSVSNALALLDQAGGDIVFRQDSGAASGIVLTHADSISGVRIIDGPKFPEGNGAEYVNRRTCEFTAEAEYVIQNAANAVLSWREQIQITGTGGPATRCRPAINAKPVRQIIYPYSVVRAVQIGQAVGHTVRPTPPGPFAPAFELEDQRTITPGSPRRLGNGLIEPSISWVYHFESPGIPLVGIPSNPPL